MLEAMPTLRLIPLPSLARLARDKSRLNTEHRTDNLSISDLRSPTANIEGETALRNNKGKQYGAPGFPLSRE